MSTSINQNQRIFSANARVFNKQIIANPKIFLNFTCHIDKVLNVIKKLWCKLPNILNKNRKKIKWYNQCTTRVS